MKPNPDVSVIIITHHRANVLPRAVQSVFNQTIHNTEIIIVDDIPDDETRTAVALLQKQNLEKFGYDCIIPIFLQEKIPTLTALRNIGIKKARGNFIAFLDDDDEWLPTKLEKQLSIFKKVGNEKIGFVGCNGTLYRNGQPEREMRIPVRGQILQKLLEKNRLINGSVAIVRKEIFDSGIMYDEKLNASENRDLWIRICVAGWEYDFVDESLVKIYGHDTGHNKKSKNERLHRRAKYNEYFFQKHRELYKQYGMLTKGLRTNGIYQFTSGEYKNARQYFMEALIINWRDYKALIGYLLATLGPIGLLLYRLYIQFK